MSVEFDEGGNDAPILSHGQTSMSSGFNEPRPSALTRLVFKLHLAKDEHGANRVFIIVTILALVLTAAVTAYEFGLLNSILPGHRTPIHYKEDVPESAKDLLPPGYYDSLPSRNK